MRKEKNSKRNNSHRKCERRGRANFVFWAETSCALGYFGATHSSSKRPHSKTRGGVANAWKILAISGSNFEMSFSVQAAIRDISISLKKIRSRQIRMNQKHEQTVRRNYPLTRNKKPLEPKPWGTKQPIKLQSARFWHVDICQIRRPGLQVAALLSSSCGQQGQPSVAQDHAVLKTKYSN